ncbi:NeuD/PglB/VioB family sugar acetyltransferase [Actinocrispum wychmicini]|uniref:Sugar O-acyltransferase (Sialic acid O-acetyltransferase NeuD family) n=1 Tax=Actinocrispum wychmicini TaxID=1213861 RepID=A0A4R2JUG2_9PSEU|nr:NeuD/PglB/VioB family sugar acetyltransferase [Actinocrispum wychmicini]TCO62682.1 sugar O-acyltransferase (sialic acid O-acetyltransferase NeuD family) [Actinocrispum wychmicini]
MNPLILVGAGGLARETLAAARLSRDVLGFVDDNPDLHGRIIDGLPVLGSTDVIHSHPDAQVVLCTASSRDRTSRRRIAARLRLPAERYATVIHPSASLAPGVTIGHGSIVLAFVAVTAPQAIGAHVVIMPHVTITHDDSIASYATFAARVALAGGVTVGECAYLGSGALVREGLSIGDDSLVGMGAVVLEDVPPNEVWAGVPARPMTADLRTAR